MTAHSRSISTGSTELCLELQKGDTGWRGWTIIRWSVTGCPMQPCLMAPRHRRANRCAKSRCYSRKWSEKKTCVIGKACNFMGHVPLLCQLTREVLFKCIWVSNLSPIATHQSDLGNEIHPMFNYLGYHLLALICFSIIFWHVTMPDDNPGKKTLQPWLQGVPWGIHWFFGARVGAVPPLVNIQKVMVKIPCLVRWFAKMVMFHSYLGLLEGIQHFNSL